MTVFRHLRLRTKLLTMIAVPLVGLLVTSGLVTTDRHPARGLVTQR